MTKTGSDARSTLAGNPALDAAVRDHLGAHLRILYGNPAVEKLPQSLARLANRVAQVIRAHTEPVDQDFVKGIMGSLPSLRNYARSLTRDIHQAEDLVQETILKAISRQESFSPGTNIEAWIFTILRNQFLSHHRRSQREVEDADGGYAGSLISIPDQEDRLVVQELEVALAQLSEEQREAIILVGMDGLSYEETADRLGVKIGTIKSRVNRARNRLAELMGLSGAEGIATDRRAER